LNTKTAQALAPGGELYSLARQRHRDVIGVQQQLQRIHFKGMILSKSRKTKRQLECNESIEDV